MISRDQINKHYLFIINREKTMFIKHGQKPFACAYSVDSNGKITIIGLPFSNAEEKNNADKYLRQEAKRLDTQAFIYVSEIWYQRDHSDAAKWDKIMKEGTIEGHPDSDTALMINLETKYESRTRIWCVVRDRKNKISLVEQVLPKDGVGFQGRFMNLLRDGIQHNYSSSDIDGELQ